MGGCSGGAAGLVSAGGEALRTAPPIETPAHAPVPKRRAPPGAEDMRERARRAMADASDRRAAGEAVASRSGSG